MKVKCVSTTALGFDYVSARTLADQCNYKSLAVGQEYFVSAMAIFEDANIVYYLIDSALPRFFPNSLFQTLDNRLPSSWHININKKGNPRTIYYIAGFEELAKNPEFYWKLIADDEAALAVYRKRVEEMKEVLL